MGRTRRQPVLSLTISRQASTFIDQMLARGLWGRNRAQVARELLYSAIREEIAIERKGRLRGR